MERSGHWKDADDREVRGAMATATYSMPVSTPGPRHSGAMMLPPIHEAIPQIFSTGPRDKDGYAIGESESHPPHPGSYDHPASGATPAASKRRRTSHAYAEGRSSRSESYGTGLAHGRLYPPASALAAHDTVHESSVPSLSELRLASSCVAPAPHVPQLRSAPSRRSYDRASSPDRPTLPSIFGNDHTHLASLPHVRERASIHPLSAYDPGMAGPAYPPLQPLQPSPPETSVLSSAASYGVPFPPNALYPARPEPHQSSRQGSFSGPPALGLRSLERSSFLASDAHSMGFEGMSEYPEEQKTKRRRGNLPKSTTDILKGWFHDHLDHPYPSEEEKQILMCRTRLTMSQISNWFINCRRRHLPMYNRQMRAELIASEEGGGRDERSGEDERMRGS